jgi:hypothetical protein
VTVCDNVFSTAYSRLPFSSALEYGRRRYRFAGGAASATAPFLDENGRFYLIDFIKSPV